MRKFSAALAACSLITALPIAGCFRQVREQVAEDSAAFIVVEGSGAAVRINIDDSVVAESAELRSDNGIRYRVGKGTHEVLVERDGQTLVRRKVYVGDGETRIITVPGS